MLQGALSELRAGVDAVRMRGGLGWNARTWRRVLEGTSRRRDPLGGERECMEMKAFYAAMPARWNERLELWDQMAVEGVYSAIQLSALYIHEEQERRVEREWEA